MNTQHQQDKEQAVLIGLVDQIRYEIENGTIKNAKKTAYKVLKILKQQGVTE